MLKTVEIPFSGHPDKICDQIVDGILDEYIKRDPKCHTDIQALGSHSMLMIGGTVDSRADFDISSVAQSIYNQIDAENETEIFVNIERPSEDLAKNIVNGGAHGTSIVYGYATKETREFLPRAYVYAWTIARRLHELRKHNSKFSFLLPDGKVQIALDGEKVISVALSVQHKDLMDETQLKSLIISSVIEPTIGSVEHVKMFLNSAGSFCGGGFAACGGASGRKQLAATYGGLLPSGGASFAGKDPYQPARCGMYMSRFVAKNLVARGISGNVLVHAGYTIGAKDPTFLRVITGGGKDITAEAIKEFDFRPEAIVERLDLARPLYRDASVFGQFGNGEMPWEKLI